MRDKQDITLRIGQVSLKMTIRPEEEQLLRDTARDVNIAYNEYKRRFPASSPEEVLAKVTLLFAQGYTSAAQQIKQLTPLLDSFEEDLDRLLKK